jgi:aryl-alcohol dehydrogenase-like predicted oxidoreductase
VASPWLENADWDRIERVEKYAEQRGVSLLDIAIAGLAAQPAVGSVISGATRGEQVRTNAAAMRWQPDEADLADLDEITRG